MNRITSVCASISLYMLVTCIGCNTYKPNVTFIEAINAGNEKAVTYYIKQGEMVNQKDENGTPLIMLAAEKGYASIVKRLLKVGANPNATDQYGDTALMRASGEGHTEVVRALLEAGADINVESPGSHFTALMIASMAGHTEIINLFKKASNIKENKTDTALIYASANGDNKKVQSLLKSGANVNAREFTNDFTPLIAASLGEHIETIKILLQAGADIDAKDDLGWTALRCAVDKGNAEAVQILIDAGANINTQDVHGFTPLMATVIKGNIQMARALINAKANVNIKSTDGYRQTALSMARVHGRADFVKLLRQSGAKE